MKVFIKIVIVLYCVLLVPQAALSQNGREKVELLRVSFISKQLELNTAESEKFWPVYNEYNDKIKAIRKNLRQSYHKRSESLSDTEAEELYQLDIKSKEAEADLHKQYGEKIKMIIGAKKYVRLRVAEEKFKQEILKTIKDQKTE